MTPPPDPLRPLLHLLSPDILTLTDALRIIALLVQSVEASGDPYLQRALSDAMRQGADRLRI